MLNRIKYIDIMRAIGIILVVFGHCIGTDNAIKKIIYSFHMIIFFVISGLLLKIERKNIKEYGIKKFFQLIVPYFIWNFIYCGINKQTILLILYGTRKSILAANGLSSLWFLVAYFWTSIIIQLIIDFSFKFKKNNIFIILCTVSLSLIGFSLSAICNFKYNIPLEIDVALQMLFFVLLGYFIRNIIVYLNKKINLRNVKITKFGIFIILTILTIFTAFLNKNVNYVIIADALYGSIVFIIPAILGTIAVIVISSLLESFEKLSYYISIVGKNTIGILCTHKIFISMFSFIKNVIKMKLISVLVIFVLSFSFSLAVSLIIDKFLPNLLGKNIGVKK